MKEKNSPTAAILLIGNEILSGRTQDLNGNYLAQKLLTLGIKVREIRIVPDDKNEIIHAVKSMKRKYTYVFTSGGIGPTHDDITADCVAEAFGVSLPVNEEAKKIVASNYPRGEDDLNEARLRMARIPMGASLIGNPVSKAPGFHIGNVFVLAGVPKIFQAMLKFVIPKLRSSSPIISRTITIHKPEGEIAAVLSSVASKFPQVTIGSYPFEDKESLGVNIVITYTDQETIDVIADCLSRI